MIKIKLNCLEGAYISIGLTNEEVSDDFEIELYEKAANNATVSLFHDVSNSKLKIFVEGFMGSKEWETMYEDERLGSQMF